MSDRQAEVSYAAAVVSGMTRTGGGRLLSQGAQFLVTLILMRLLTPADFGLLAMVVVFSGFATEFADLGFSAALVQSRDLEKADGDTAFWMTLGLGTALSAAFVLGAPLIASFFDTPRLSAVTRGFAPIFMVATIRGVPMAMMQREHRFGRMAVAEVGATLLAGIIGISMALSGHGVWSLVAMQLALAAGTSGLALALSGWRPGLRVERAAARRLIAYGGGVTGFNLVNYWARQADNLLIGKFMSASALGLYSRAYALMLLPMSQLGPVVSRVVFPVLSSIQSDLPRVRIAYLRVVRMLAALAFPMMLGMCATADTLVPTILGAQWDGAIPLVRILSAVGAVQVLLSPSGLIYQSQGRTDRMFKWGAFASTVIVAAIGIGAWLGSPVSVAWSYLAAILFLTLPCLKYGGDLIALSPWTVLGSVAVPFAFSALMAGTVWFLGATVLAPLPVSTRFVVQVGVGIVLYVAPMMWLRPEPVLEVERFIGHLTRGRG